VRPFHSPSMTGPFAKCARSQTAPAARSGHFLSLWSLLWLLPLTERLHPQENGPEGREFPAGGHGITIEAGHLPGLDDQ